MYFFVYNFYINKIKNQVGPAPGERAPVSSGSQPVHILHEIVQLPPFIVEAHGRAARSRAALSLRALFENLQRPIQFAAPHPLQSRRCPRSRLSRMRQDVRHVQRTQATHAHSLERQTVPVRGLPQSLHSGKL